MVSLRTSLSWKMLAENRLRFFFSVIGIGFAVALIFVNQGFQDGLLRQVKAYLLNSGADIYVSQEGVDSFLFGASAVSTEMKSQILKTNGVSEVTDVVSSLMMFDYNNEKTPALVIGYDPNEEFGGPWKLREGRYLEGKLRLAEPESANSPPLFSKKQVKPKEVILDYAMAQKYGLSVGDMVEIQDYDFEIVGLSDGTSSWIASPIFMSRESAKRILKTTPSVTSFFLITAKEGIDVIALRNEIVRRSADVNRISERVSGIEVLTAQELAKKDEDFTREFFVSMMGVINLLTYVIGVLIIGLVIYILTLEKTRDYAVLKAIGAKNGHVLYIVLLQTIISAAMGFVVGLSVAKGFEYLTTQLIATQFTVVVEEASIVAVLIGIFWMSLIAAVIPVRRVFTVEPTLVFSSRQN